MKILAVCRTVWMTVCVAVAGVAVSADMAARAPIQRQALAKPVTTFGYLDADKDRRLSLQEARVDWAVAEGFTAADVNHDSYLDADEFKLVGRG